MVLSMAVLKPFGFHESCGCWEMIIEINDLILLYHQYHGSTSIVSKLLAYLCWILRPILKYATVQIELLMAILRHWQAFSSSILIIPSLGYLNPQWKGSLNSQMCCCCPFTWHDDLVAGDTFGGELITVAVVAEQRLVLAGEGLIRQRAITAETAEAVLVIMPVLVEEFLAATQKQQRFKRDHCIIEIKLT